MAAVSDNNFVNNGVEQEIKMAASAPVNNGNEEDSIVQAVQGLMDVASPELEALLKTQVDMIIDASAVYVKAGLIATSAVAMKRGPRKLKKNCNKFVATAVDKCGVPITKLVVKDILIKQSTKQSQINILHCTRSSIDNGVWTTLCQFVGRITARG